MFAAKREKVSALGELLGATGTAQAHFFPLHFAGVAGDEACLGERGFEGSLVVDQRAGDAVAHRTGLAGFAAAVDVDLDVEAFDVLGENEGLLDDHDGGLTAEILLDVFPVDRDFAGALLDEDAGHGAFATACAVIPVSDHRVSLDVESLGLLGAVRMLCTPIDLELLDHGVTERAFGQHALDCQFQRTAGVTRLHILEFGGVDAAGIAGVTVVGLVVGFVAGHTNFGGVDDNDEVTGIDVRGVDGFVFATQTEGHFAGDPTENLVLCVNHEPLMHDFGRFGAEGFHGCSYERCLSEI